MIGFVICSHGGVASCGASHCRIDASIGSPWVSTPRLQSSWSLVDALLTSAPVQNARPAPVTITVQTSASPSVRAKASWSSSIIASLIALRTSGRFSVMQTAWSRCSYSMVV